MNIHTCQTIQIMIVISCRSALAVMILCWIVPHVIFARLAQILAFGAVVGGRNPNKITLPAHHVHAVPVIDGPMAFEGSRIDSILIGGA